MKVAALDLGTNTFLCLIAEVGPLGVKQVFTDLHEVVRLGQDVDKTRRLHPEALARAKNCLSKFSEEIRKHQVSKVLAMATSAARDVENREELFDICRSLDIPLEIISGDNEAVITFGGALSGRSTKGNILVVDVGGGSTEYILGVNGEIRFAKSLNIGAVRMTERFVSSQPTSDLEMKNLSEYIDQEVQKIATSISGLQIDEIIAVAGTPTALAAIDLGGFSEEKVHGYLLTDENLENKIEIFKRMSTEEKKTKYLLGGRADVILAGTCILARTLKNLGVSQYTVSTKGVRYGVANELYRRNSSLS